MTEFVEFDAIEARRKEFKHSRQIAGLPSSYAALSEILVRVSWEGTPEMLRDHLVSRDSVRETVTATLERLHYACVDQNSSLAREKIEPNIPCLIQLNKLDVVAIECTEDYVVLYDFANDVFLQESYNNEPIVILSITAYSRAYRDSEQDQKSDKWINHLFYQHFDDIKKLFLLSLIINILGAVGPFFIMGVYNFALPSESYSTLIWLTIGSIAVAATEYLFKWLRMNVMSTTGRELAVYISYHVTNKLLWLPYKLTSGAGVSAQLRRLKDIDQFRKLVTAESTISYFDMPFFFVFLIAIMIISGTAALAVVVGVILIIAYGAYTRIASGYAQSQSSKANAMTQYQWNEIIYGITSVQGLPITKVMGDRFESAISQSIRDSTKLSRTSSGNQGVGQALTQTIGASCVVITVMAVIAGDVDAGAMMAVIILVWKAITPIMGIFNSLSKAKQVSASSSQINALMSMPDDRQGLEKSLPLEHFGGLYVVDALTYRHPNAPQGLTQITFTTHPSDKISIVGPAGCGKTSLLNILFGLVESYQGEVKLSNLNIRQFNGFRLRQAIGYIPYQFTFFHGTLRENFHLYNGRFEEDAMLAWVHRFSIGHWLPNGLDTKINDTFIDSLPTSVREALRLSIGLGPLNKGTYLIDEPCLAAGIDVKRVFTSLLTELMQRTTVIYTTSDKQLITACDNCLLLDSNGGQKYFGFPDKVLASLE